MSSWKPSHLTREQMEERRRAGAALLREGKLNKAEIARQLGVSTTSVSRWQRALEQGGLRALRRHSISGRPMRLSPMQRRSLLRSLRKGAVAAGFPTERWTLQRIGILIEREFSVTYNPHYLSRLLKACHWSHQYPIAYATERDETLIHAWLRKDWPRIKKSAAEARRHWVS